MNEETNAYLSRQYLVNLLGQDGAVRLIAAFGGRRSYVPAPGSPNFAQFSGRVGPAVATAMSAAFGGQQVSLPMRAISKRDEIAAMHARGLSPSEISRRLKAHERYVYRVLAGLAAQSVK